MLVKVECPFCGNSTRVDPARVGEFIDCPKCRARLNVPNPATDPNVEDKITFENEPLPESKNRPSNRPMWAATVRLAVGAVLAMLIIGFLVVQRVQKMQRPVVRVRPGQGPQQPGFGHRRHLQQPGGDNQPNGADNQAEGNNQGPPRIRVVWRVVPDPPHNAAVLPPNRVVHIPIPPGPNPEVLFSATPSTIVAVGNVGHGREHREIWDYRANRRIGTTRGLRTHSENLGGYYRPVSALSPDGRYFATQGQAPLELAVWNVTREKQLALLKPQHEPTAGIAFAAFARPDELLVCGFGTPCQELRVAGTSRRKIRGFPQDKQLDNRSLALSPGGRYVVVFDKRSQSLSFYDISMGGAAGERVLPFGDEGTRSCEGTAFSPDGREVAALLTHNGDTWLVCWSLGSGRLVDQIDFQGNLRTILASDLPYPYAPLEWFPDGRRWLVYGAGIVDRRSAKLTSKLPDEPNRWRFGMRHVVGDDCVLSVVEENDHFVLASLRVGQQNVEHAAPAQARVDAAIKR